MIDIHEQARQEGYAAGFRDGSQQLAAAKEALEQKMSRVTRVTLVNHSTASYPNEKRGRVFEKWDIRAELSFQDNGRTLKVFLKDNGGQ